MLMLWCFVVLTGCWFLLFCAFVFGWFGRIVLVCDLVVVGVLVLYDFGWCFADDCGQLTSVGVACWGWLVVCCLGWVCCELLFCG